MGIDIKFQIEKLIALQKIDSELDIGNKSLARIPVQIESAQSAMEEKKKKLEDAKNEIQSLHNTRKKLEQDTEAEMDHMSRTKVKLPTVKTNREYTAILHEIDAVKEKVASFEDRELEIMEALEAKESGIPSLEVESRQEENQFKEYKAKKEAEGERVKQELVGLASKREDVVRTLEKKQMESYRKVAQLRDGVAVVRLLEDVCQGCFQIVLPQMVIEVKTFEKIHQCQHCTRFLYWEEETETAMPK